MDSEFEKEQRHLSVTYEKLLSIRAEQQAKMNAVEADASADKETMAEELTFDLADFDSTLETIANVESLNRIVESYNFAHATAHERLDKAELLLRQPYFAKVVLALNPNDPPREIYLGAAGMSDETGRLFIVDWRSPVAETYYNQGSGRMSYKADGRTITVDLLLRRQFDITGSVLKAYFDTTVAIEDPLLLQALSRQRTSSMSAITATIQKEQNEVIRHDEVGVLLVSGIAGSGKTSVLLQRIAYLLYRHRNDLKPDQVHLISPNPVFSRYIAHVLPDMGESNPQTHTWKSIARTMGIAGGDRGEYPNVSSLLDAIDKACESAALTPGDCRAVRYKNQIYLSAATVASVVRHYSRIPDSRRQCARVAEDLHDQLETHRAHAISSDEIQGLIADMDPAEQSRRFGAPIDLSDEDAMREAADIYLQEFYEPIHRVIDECGWLSTRRIAKRLLDSRGLKPLERAYLKLVFAGLGDTEARYVMIDEVQDYTEAQLRLLARAYPQADFLLLGDPSQAIFPQSASYKTIESIFKATHGRVSRCALNTSYRSSPEITNLFAPLADADDAMEISSVRRPGTTPVIHSFEDERSWRETLIRTVLAAEDKPNGLCAIIMRDDSSAKAIRRVLGDLTPRQLNDRATLPECGVVFLDVALAKGLEFDEVVIPDADADTYGTDDISRHRLYTAISRATQKVTILANGPLTPLLKSQ